MAVLLLLVVCFFAYGKAIGMPKKNVNGHFFKLFNFIALCGIPAKIPGNGSGCRMEIHTQGRTAGRFNCLISAI